MRIRIAATIGVSIAIVLGSVAVTSSTAYAGTVADTAAPHCAQHVDDGRTACAATPEQARAYLGVQPRYLVARLWRDARYRGPSLSYYKSRPCTPTLRDREIPVPVVPGGWNDVLSSVQTDLSTPNTRCSLRIYEHGRFRGAHFTVNHYTPNLGGFGWNDRASSWYIS